METKELILAGLEGKSKQECLYEKYCEMENEFVKSLSELPKYEEMCDCEERGLTALTISSDWAKPIILQRCLKCGGDIPL